MANIFCPSCKKNLPPQNFKKKKYLCNICTKKQIKKESEEEIIGYTACPRCSGQGCDACMELLFDSEEHSDQRH